ncbi:putative actin- protein 2/3 complex subunit 3 [Globodera pallida]|nr:putative actin- protein 2/3 complex subunit 3 [Globodera pallida]
MPAYHSKFAGGVSLVGNIAILPIKTACKGPAPKMDRSADEDIIDEALTLFKPNVFFRNFEIKGPADRTLIYLFLYITECLKKLQKSPKKLQAGKDLLTLALDSHRTFPIPGEASFPFPGLFKPPANAQEEETMRAYLQQLRQELGARLLERVFPDPEMPPSKWWLCFAKRRFMDKQLTQNM